MKNKTEEIIVSRLRIIAISALVGLLSVTCSDKEKRDLIPEKKFTAILSDIYLVNGLIIIPEVRETFAGRDTALNYYDIIENHGYSKEQMENTIKYYFSENPKKLIKIYDVVIGKLSETESLLHLSHEETTDEAENIWKDRSSYILTDASKNNKLYFDYKFQDPGFYLLEFSATVYPDDQSHNPHLTALTFHADSVGKGKANYLSVSGYIKDGHSHKYKTTLRVLKETPVVFEVYLYDYENNPDFGDPHAEIRDILITFSP